MVKKSPLKTVEFIINPISGAIRRPDRIIQMINEFWKNSGIDYSVIKTNHRGHAIELAKKAVAGGIDMVVAVGGDGTINEIGRGLTGSETALGVVPAGSGNGFARNFDIPLRPDDAVKALINPCFRRIDVGKINGHHFFNVAGIGLDAEISAHFDKFGIRGPLPYFYVGIREFLRYEPETIEIYLNEGKKIECKPLILSFANAPQYGNGAIIAPNAKPDDGLLDVCILYPLSSGKALVNIKRLFDGTVDKIDEMEIYQSAKATILRKQKGFIHTDGDPHLEAAEITVEVLAGQLIVAVAGKE